MRIKSWDTLPLCMQCEEVKTYYELVKRRSLHLVGKRVFDIVCSLCLLLILSPVFAFVTCWIRLDSKGPAFYRQQRVTQYGRRFWIIKFRTMVQNADQKGALVTSQNDQRITKVGAKIRKCRLDELPQLINVLKGEMTFVGTRPEVPKYVAGYTPIMRATLLLPAGITSLASIKFKDEDAILAQAKEANQTVDEAYMQRVLPRKMQYNLLALQQVGVLSDIKTCFLTITHI